MFDITASRDLLVRSFDFNTADKRNDLVQVYTRSGSFSGHELDESGWQLVYSKNTTYMGRNILTTLGDFDTGVTIRAGESRAFVILTAHFILYDMGNLEGDVLASDESLTIFEGIGIGQFPATGDLIYSPRKFRGNIR
jgi:hypothetical protein